jgi:hypothetical protein
MDPILSDQFGLFVSHPASGSHVHIQFQGAGISTYTISDMTLFNLATLFASANTWTAPQKVATVNSPNLGSIRFADQFPGTDWCAKVTAADTDLGATPGEIWVNHAAGISACVSAPILSTSVPRVLRFIQTGIYSIAVGWTLVYKSSGNSNTAFIAPPGTQLLFTGSAGMTIDGTAAENGARNIYWENLTVFGNSSVTNGLTLKKVTSSTFVNFKGGRVAGVALLCQFCVANTFIRPKISGNDSDQTIGTAEGIKFDWISSPKNASNSNLLISPIVEGVKRVPGIGIHVAHAGEVVAMGGTSEGNIVGIQVDTSLPGFDANSFSDMDLEANIKNDIIDNGTSTEFQQIQSTGTATIGPSAVGTRILNGRFNQLTIMSGATGVHL